MNRIQEDNHEPELPGRYSTLVEALLAAPPERPFITMWRDEDDIQEVTFGVHLKWGCRGFFTKGSHDYKDVASTSFQ